MAIEFNFRTELDPVAAYAAVIATCALAWNIVLVLLDGPKLRSTANPNMVLNTDPNTTYTTFKVRNTGTRTSTLETISLTYWPNFWNKFTNKHMKTFVVIDPSIPGIGNCTLPFELEPGKNWTGFIRQTEELETFSKQGILIANLHHSASKKPITRRIRAIKKQ